MISGISRKFNSYFIIIKVIESLIMCQLSALTDLKLQNPHASKRENMKASTSFIVSTLISLFQLTSRCLISCQNWTGEYSEQIKIVSRTDY